MTINSNFSSFEAIRKNVLRWWIYFYSVCFACVTTRLEGCPRLHDEVPWCPHLTVLIYTHVLCPRWLCYFTGVLTKQGYYTHTMLSSFDRYANIIVLARITLFHTLSPLSEIRELSFTLRNTFTFNAKNDNQTSLKNIYFPLWFIYLFIYSAISHVFLLFFVKWPNK